MFKSIFFSFTLLYIFLGLVTHSASAQQKTLAKRIAIVPFYQADQTTLIKTNIADIIKNDLNNSGIFNITEQSGSLESPHYLRDVNFKYWKELNVQYLIIGKIKQGNGVELSLEFELINIEKGKRTLGLRFQTEHKKIRSASHGISNSVYEKLTGARGDFSDRIAFVKSVTNGELKYQLVIIDYDGFNQQIILDSNNLIESPTWSPDSTSLAYISHENGKPEVFTQKLATSERRKWNIGKGICESISWSPNSEKLALTVVKNDNRDIFILDLEKNKMHRKSAHRSDDYDPIWNSSGSAIIYTSTRNGTRQLFRLDVDRSLEDVVTSRHENFSNPASSNFEDSVYAVSTIDGLKQISRLSTNGAANKIIAISKNIFGSPIVSTNDSMLAYISASDKKKSLIFLALNSNRKWKLSNPSGDILDISWGTKFSHDELQARNKPKKQDNYFDVETAFRQPKKFPKYIRTAGRHYHLLASNLNEYEKYEKELYRITMSSKKNSRYLVNYWKKNLLSKTQLVYDELLLKYKNAPKSRDEYNKFQATYGQLAWDLYLKSYEDITFPGDLDPGVKTQMTRQSKRLKTMIGAYAEKYGDIGIDLAKVIEEIKNFSWSYQKANKVAKKYYPTSDFPINIKNTLDDIKKNWQKYFDKMPSNSEPKKYALSVIQEINKLSKHKSALDLIDQEKYYLKWAVPNSVRKAVENVKERELAALRNDGSFPIWKKREAYFRKKMKEFGIVHGVYTGDFSYAKRKSSFGATGAQLFEIVSGVDLQTDFWGLEAYLRYQLEYFRWQCPRFKEKYPRQLVAFSYHEQMLGDTNIRLSSGASCLNCGSIEEVGEPAIKDAQKILDSFSCGKIDSYAHNAYQMVMNDPKMLVRR